MFIAGSLKSRWAAGFSEAYPKRESDNVYYVKWCQRCYFLAGQFKLHGWCTTKARPLLLGIAIGAHKGCWSHVHGASHRYRCVLEQFTYWNSSWSYPVARLAPLVADDTATVERPRLQADDTTGLIHVPTQSAAEAQALAKQTYRRGCDA